MARKLSLDRGHYAAVQSGNSSEQKESFAHRNTDTAVNGRFRLIQWAPHTVGILAQL
jgi:hypothetical protein